MELRLRVDVAWTGYREMGKWWWKCHSLRLVIIVFRAKVQSPLLFGTVAFPLSDADYAALDKVLLGLGRRVLGYRAVYFVTGPDGPQKRQHSNDHIWRLLTLAPSSVELRVQRLHWLQEQLRWPDDHAQLFAAMFGRLPFQSTFNRMGELLPGANPWVKQLQTDLLSLSDFDDLSGVVECAQSGKLTKLWTDSDLKTAVMDFDFSVLRRTRLTVCIPPPGTEPLVPLHVPPPPSELPFVCQELAAEGHVCGAAFATLRQLCAHQRRTRGGTHGKISTARALTITWQCTYCHHHFASVEICKRHVELSTSRGHCTGPGSSHHFASDTPDAIECPICSCTFACFQHYAWHATQHLLLFALQPQTLELLPPTAPCPAPPGPASTTTPPPGQHDGHPDWFRNRQCMGSSAEWRPPRAWQRVSQSQREQGQGGHHNRTRLSLSSDTRQRLRGSSHGSSALASAAANSSSTAAHAATARSGHPIRSYAIRRMGTPVWANAWNGGRRAWRRGPSPPPPAANN